MLASDGPGHSINPILHVQSLLELPARLVFKSAVLITPSSNPVGGFSVVTEHHMVGYHHTWAGPVKLVTCQQIHKTDYLEETQSILAKPCVEAMMDLVG